MYVRIDIYILTKKSRLAEVELELVTTPKDKTVDMTPEMRPAMRRFSARFVSFH